MGKASDLRTDNGSAAVAHHRRDGQTANRQQAHTIANRRPFWGHSKADRMDRDRKWLTSPPPIQLDYLPSKTVFRFPP